MSRIFIVMGFFLYTAIANAALFGANSYEECMADGKSGRTNFEMQALAKKCRNDFPKLSKLAKMKDVTLVCRDYDEKNIYHIEVKRNKVLLLEIGNVEFIKTSHDKVKLTFKGDSKDKDTKEAVNIYGNIELLNGIGGIKVEYKNLKKEDLEYQFSCYEK